jgi:CRP-like cAMP-binding protein
VDEKVYARRGPRTAEARASGSPGGVNRLLSLLPLAEFERLEARFEEVDVPFRQMLYKRGEPIEHAYFPNAGVFSVIKEPEEDGGMVVEVATVGNEGMVGLPLVLGGETTPDTCFCQVPGQAARIEAGALKEALRASPALHGLLLRYTQALLSQIAQGAACNRMHPVEERCARWLLMTHDRVSADHFVLTQEFLGQMLGVRRPSVSVAASMLQKAGLIRYARGLVVVTDRAGLEAAACGCYGVIKSEYDRLLK